MRKKYKMKKENSPLAAISWKRFIGSWAFVRVYVIDLFVPYPNTARVHPPILGELGCRAIDKREPTIEATEIRPRTYWHLQQGRSFIIAVKRCIRWTYPRNIDFSYQRSSFLRATHTFQEPRPTKLAIFEASVEESAAKVLDRLRTCVKFFHSFLLGCRRHWPQSNPPIQWLRSMPNYNQPALCKMLPVSLLPDSLVIFRSIFVVVELLPVSDQSPMPILSLYRPTSYRILDRFEQKPPNDRNNSLLPIFTDEIKIV